MNLITIGKIINTRGLNGEVKVASLTDFASLRYRKGKRVYLEMKGSYLPLTIKRYHSQGGFDFLQFEEISSLREVEDWPSHFLYADQDEIVLAKDSFYYHQLKGLKVIDQDGVDSGTVSEVENFSGRTSLRITLSNQKEMLVPFLKVFIKQVNLSEQTITIHFLEGMK